MSGETNDYLVAAILAGGRGTRIGGDKAMAPLGGRPLIEHPLAAARDAGLRPMVVAKRSTRLPPLDADLLIEPDVPHHPITGIVTALQTLPAVLAIPCDMPFLSPELLTLLARGDGDVVAARLGGQLQPLPALYRSAALPALEAALAAEASIRSAMSSLHVTTVDARTCGDVRRLYLRVNSASELERAEAMLLH